MKTAFPLRHPWDRTFHLVMLLIVWTAIVSGFAYHNVTKLMAGQLTYPWIVHVHGVVFVGWLLLLTAQVLFVRRGQVALHRRIGMFGAGLAAVMVPLGVATGITTEQLKFGTPASDPKFLSVMFADMLVVGGLIGAGIVLRGNPMAHKRLMLVASLVMTDAGFGRWLSPQIVRWTGVKNFWDIQTFADGGWLFIRFQLLPAYTLIATVGVYDLITRKRLHPAYCWAVAFSLPVHMLAGWLYFQPFWHAIALWIIGVRPPPMLP
jgi:uncharacterized membrane protein YozB (DUF420 family)